MWSNDQLNEQLAIIDGKQSPSILIREITYLHSYLKEWKVGNIWIKDDRIVYVGEKLPEKLSDTTEIYEGAGQYAVPGYIEPHVHPFQLYNIETFSHYAAQTGTTTSISDNLIHYLGTTEEENMRLLDEIQALPFHIFSWVRLDSQTYRKDETELFNVERLKRWLARKEVIMGGELTGWPQLMRGNSTMREMVAALKQQGIRLEGHLPGASEKTLAKMTLLGVSGDHEAMTVEEVLARLQQGYAVTLRNSSIRPDLQPLLEGLVREDKPQLFENLMMTTDGSTPVFYENGVMNQCIQIAIEAGVPVIDAYHMASFNSAKRYDFTHLLGSISTGRMATLNILSHPEKPTPHSVLAKGQWIVKNQQKMPVFSQMDWSGFPPMELAFEVTPEDLTPVGKVGIELVNDVITKPYEIQINTDLDELPLKQPESFFTIIERTGQTKVSTLIKGFDQSIQGVASSYSNTGDIILIGKSKKAMRFAFERLKELQGGFVLVDEQHVLAEIPLPIQGSLSSLPVEEMIPIERHFRQQAKQAGYQLGDIIYTFLFLQSTHLPYVRATKEGIVDVLKGQVITPAQKRNIL